MRSRRTHISASASLFSTPNSLLSQLEDYRETRNKPFGKKERKEISIAVYRRNNSNNTLQ
jgi:hypothetical protein